MIAVVIACMITGLCPIASGQVPAGATEIEREVYLDQLEGFWLAQSIANWTGLQTEARRREPPFYTDADWPNTFDGRSLRFITDQDPWKADDDTDIEYVYASLMEQHATPLLSATQIRDGWISHINDFIWVSNARARELMNRGVSPPGTSLPSANNLYLRIDAQLTTEIFGLYAPGMPALALELADLPISTTARGHAAHASQYFVVLHALGAARGASALSPQGIEQLVIDARAYLPDTSKAADIVDTVLADYQSNPDLSNWERTRDLVADRYQINDSANGFRYLHWTESSVNFGAALVCLLYGQGDLRETIRIGTLTGWDSDNPTATTGGLVGLLLGADGVRDAFPEGDISDRYWISRTRDGMPDYLPDDIEAEDLFSLLAKRMLTAIDLAVGFEGGVVNAQGWLIPPQHPADERLHNPMSREGWRSANFTLREAGMPPTPTTSLTTQPVAGPGSPWANRFANGHEYDPTGREVLFNTLNQYFWSRGAPPDANGEITLQVSYAETIKVHTIRFIEGDHFADGGWFDSLTVEVLHKGAWTKITTTPSEPLDPSVPFQIIDFQLDALMLIDAVRVRGIAGGTAQFITASELDVLTVPVPRARRGWDINNDLRVDIEDLYGFNRDPFDLNEDGVIDEQDAKELEHAIRWRELQLLQDGRR